MIYICSRCQHQFRVTDPARAAVTPCEACGGRLLLAPGQAPPAPQPAPQVAPPPTVAPGQQPPPGGGAPQVILDKGQMFRQYQIQGKLGQGGMGVVYKAMDLSLQRLGALKILPPAFAQQNLEARNRFIREARSAAQLIHQNIVTVFEAGEEGGLLYIAMEFIDGPSVSNLIKRKGKLDIEVALKIVKDAAQGLAFAHGMNLVHRDIKPDNILLHPMGMAKVADFGLAKSSSRNDASLTGTGLIVGTPHYMAPEQCEGEEVDRRADIYALGVTLFHMLTGEQPYQAKTTMAILHKHVYDPVPDPRDLVPEIPGDLAHVTMRAMEKKPDDRFQTAEEMLEELEDVSLTEADLSPEDLQRTGGEGEMGASTLAIQDLAMEEGAGDSQVDMTAEIEYSAPEEDEEDEEDDSVKLLAAAVVVVLVILAAAVFLGKDYLKKRFGKTTEIAVTSSTSVPVVKETTTTIIPEAPKQGIEGIGKTFRKSLNTAPRKIKFLADKSFLVLLEESGDIIFWSLLGKSPPITKAPGELWCLTASPDGKMLAMAYGSHVRVSQGGNNSEMYSFETPGSQVFSLDFNPSSGRLAVGGSDGVLRLIDSRDGRRTQELKGHQARIIRVKFSSDMKYIFSASEDGEIRLWNAAKLELEKSLKVPGGALSRICFGANFDHTSAAYIKGRKVYLKDLTSDDDNDRLLGLNDEIPTAIEFSWKARRLAVGTAAGSVFVFKLPGPKRVQLKAHRGKVTALSFSFGGFDDSRFLATGGEDGEVLVRPMEDLDMQAVAPR